MRLTTIAGVALVLVAAYLCIKGVPHTYLLTVAGVCAIFAGEFERRFK